MARRVPRPPLGDRRLEGDQLTKVLGGNKIRASILERRKAPLLKAGNLVGKRGGGDTSIRLFQLGLKRDGKRLRVFSCGLTRVKGEPRRGKASAKG